jgi:multidrug resistance efflux pump
MRRGRFAMGLLAALTGLLRLAITLAMVGVAAVLTLALWRAYMLAPWTRDGRVEVQVIDVAPEVSGTVASVAVQDNQLVHKGDILFALDPVRFQLAIEQAQSHYDTAREQQRLRESDVKRRQGLTGIVSAEEQERVANTAAVAGATLSGARAALDLAKLNLQRSVLYSPVNGYVTHLRLQPGDYASAGQARMAVVDADSFWVSGYFEETKIAKVQVGDVARIKLMGFAAPLAGHVQSIGRGINDPNDTINSQGLPAVNPVFTWVRLAQRVPVRIAIDQVPNGVPLIAGLTASISVEPAAPAPNAPAAPVARGRLLSWLEDNL